MLTVGRLELGCIDMTSMQGVPGLNPTYGILNESHK